ncbi:mitochondrial 54S ribosomal protein uL15m [Aspergillus puulaauensis]|uniref:YmL10 n=1 Tax=Aspergillus puulaauensis TaxID=1220207 RepID=A0A7R7XQP7_9EURO|nr:YmL10 [Aspergillus puulaauensis]BCS25956.1 YmL10 [Aspergillus puulaauensis]
MPPRLQILPLHLRSIIPRPNLAQPSQLSLCAPSQSRNAHILASLSDNPGAYSKRIRRGRGPASGKGKTSGRGHKGQGQHGKVPAGFNGGQTPEIIVHGERGFNNIFALDLAPANLDRIQEWIDQGRIDPTKPITVRELAQSKCIHGPKEGVKLLARGIDFPAKSTFKSSTTQQSSTTTATESQPQSEAQTAAAEEEALVDEKTVLKQPIHLVVSRASASAIAAVEAAGGSVTTRFYTKAAITRIMKRETHSFLSTQWAEESGNAALHAAAGLDFSSSAGAAVAGAMETKVMSEKGLKYRLPDPTKRRDIEYYRDPAHRGYLSHLLKPLEGPSLFFRSPVERKSAAGSAKKEKILPENRLW